MRPDLAIVGGGIVGLGLGLAAARRGMRCVVLERGEIGGVATRLSGAIVRTHYAHAPDARLAWEGLRDFEGFAEEVGGDAGFRAAGFAHIVGPSAQERAELAARVEMLRRVGIETRVVDASELSRLAPGLAVEDGETAAWEPRSGYADPLRTAAAVAAAARRAGAELRQGVPVARLLVDGGRVRGVALAGDELAAGAVALCAGAWSVPLARGAGLELPIRPTAARIVRLSRPPGPLPAVVDVPNGVYLRPDGDDHAIVGRRDWVDRPISAPDGPFPPVDQTFRADCRARAARRARTGARWAAVDGWAGPLDMTPDGRPLLGPAGPDGLWLSCGWSGTGFKTALAAGRALARWIAEGVPAHPDDGELAPTREIGDSALRSPH